MTRIKRCIKALVPYRVKLRYWQSKEAKNVRAWTAEDEARAIFYADLVKEGDLVFDIGANLGNRTKVFRHLGARVVAVEPQPRCWKVLELAYSNQPGVTIVRKAVGCESGHVTMHLSDAHFLSSVSKDWISSVSASGRFSEIAWNQKMRVPLLTLDTLIESYGQPSFVKIDVEGYEYEVLKGLHQKVKALSFEFTPETFSAASLCVARLQDLGMQEFNFVDGEATQFKFGTWLNHTDILSLLWPYQKSHSLFGDIYARHSF